MVGFNIIQEPGNSHRFRNRFREERRKNVPVLYIEVSASECRVYNEQNIKASVRCHKNFKSVTLWYFCGFRAYAIARMKRNPRKVRWTKAFRKAAGKEMTIVSASYGLRMPNVMEFSRIRQSSLKSGEMSLLDMIASWCRPQLRPCSGLQRLRSGESTHSGKTGLLFHV